MGRRPWELNKFSIVAALGTSTAVTLDPTYTLDIMLHTFSTLGTLNPPPSLGVHSSKKNHSVDPPMKTMLTHNNPMNANCNLYPKFKNFVSCNTNPLFFYHPKSYTIDRTHNPGIFSFWTRTHKSISGVKHLYPQAEHWARRNSVSYFRVDSLYSFNFGNFNSLPSRKAGPLGSIFSSLFSVPGLKFSPPTTPYGTESKSFHAWHYVRGDGEENGISSEEKPVMAVVLLGWLGAQQKHLKMYVDWYNSRGIHAVTFVVPMKDLLGFKPGGKVEQHIEMLARELASWISEKEKDGRDRWLMFHTFSNTGWLSYGVILEKLLRTGDFYDKIKGCVVDSAPDPVPNPQVWALGFLAALLKKRSRLLFEPDVKNSQTKDSDVMEPTEENDPTFSEVALLTILEKFFSVMLKHPYVHKRLSEVTSILYQHQPPCPQLYIYSTADRVIPAESVESFFEEQKKAGKKVTACNMQSSPHVDHFRNFPHIYAEQLHNFLEECTQIVRR